MKQIHAADVASGKVELPDDIQFLSKAPFMAASFRQVKGERKWYVEVRASWIKSAMAAKKRARTADTVLQQRGSRIRELEREVEGLRSQIEKLEANNAQLEANNARLLSNIEEGPADRPFERSPKNYFQAAEDHGFKPRSLPLQGGLAGLEKK